MPNAKAKWTSMLYLAGDNNLSGAGDTDIAGTLESEKPPILGLLERDVQVVLNMLANVQQKTIKPLFETFVKAGSTVNFVQCTQGVTMST
jgi:hypothetical protein